jgi:PEP-CTERM motif
LGDPAFRCVDFLTREDAVVETHPLLTVSYIVPEPASLVFAGIGGLFGMRRRRA